ncbi:hypothetical protein [Aquimarina sp. I32.4]|uniref:hypothetical protein n=1 Tax=Aquimarina sp. I32.4 TaxID=2053903 RepID=UPI000CDE5A4A|nr:hypothetical protein [Aquimarina sp. I32.4]
MTDIEVYLGHLGFEGMAKEFSSEIQKTIAKTLKEEAMYPSADPARALHMNIKAKATKLAQDPMFKRDSPNDDYEIKEIEYLDKVVDGTLQGAMVITCGHKHNPYQYGKPGFPGEVDGQLLQDEFCTVYKWHEQSRRWYLLKDHPNHYCEEPEKEKSWWDINTPTTGRYNTDRGGATIWGSSTTASGFGVEPWGSNPTDHDKWGDPDISPRGGGPIKGTGGLLFFNFIVHLTKLFAKTEDAGKKVVETYGNDQSDTKKLKIKNDLQEKNIDTMPHIVDLHKIENNSYDTIAKVSRDIKGYQNALKYGNYHTNMNTQGFHWYIEITPKYEE